MIEIGQELFSLNRMEDKAAQGNEWFIRSGQNPRLVYHKPRTRHRLHRLGWAPRLNGLLTATGQRHQKCRLVERVTFRCHPANRIFETHTRMQCLFCMPTFDFVFTKKVSSNRAATNLIMHFDLSSSSIFTSRWIWFSRSKRDHILSVSLQHSI